MIFSYHNNLTRFLCNNFFTFVNFTPTISRKMSKCNDEIPMYTKNLFENCQTTVQQSPTHTAQNWWCLSCKKEISMYIVLFWDKVNCMILSWDGHAITERKQTSTGKDILPGTHRRSQQSARCIFLARKFKRFKNVSNCVVSTYA